MQGAKGGGSQHNSFTDLQLLLPFQTYTFQYIAQTTSRRRRGAYPFLPITIFFILNYLLLSQYPPITDQSTNNKTESHLPMNGRVVVCSHFWHKRAGQLTRNKNKIHLTEHHSARTNINHDLWNVRRRRFRHRRFWDVNGAFSMYNSRHLLTPLSWRIISQKMFGSVHVYPHISLQPVRTAFLGLATFVFSLSRTLNLYIFSKSIDSRSWYWCDTMLLFITKTKLLIIEVGSSECGVFVGVRRA